jgi:demethylmenaquinone methyltransferase / 2-methoxy-6-polyprenyl-1,4-benzoquinol methylase
MSEEVRQMFSQLAQGYDRTNSILSLGIHHLWRNKTVRLSGVKPGQDVLDCATGTGDLALAFKEVVGQSGTVYGTDFCAEMLEEASQKAQARGLDVVWELQDAMNLTYADDRFDVASISFGIRNTDDPAQTLSSMARVVRPGGCVAVLEFGQPTGLMKPLFSAYSQFVLPALGGMLTGEPAAYRYLHETSSTFPCRDEFVAIMESTGRFSECAYVPCTQGIAYLYLGTVA